MVAEGFLLATQQSPGETARRPRPDDNEIAGLVTVVVPARNEEGFIEACLASICAQTYEDIEIIVVDGESTDRTAELVRDIAAVDHRVRLLANPRRIIPVSLNLAVNAARGQWLVRVDAHSTVPPAYVAHAVEHLRTGKWGGVGGRKDGIGKTTQGRAIAVAMGSKFGVGNSTYHHGTAPQTVEHIPFGTYPLAVIREVGGWDENLRVNQDFEFDHRVRLAGYELLFDPELRIDWHSRQSIRELERQYARYGEGKVKVLQLHPASIKPRQVAPIVLWPAFVVAAALLPFKRAAAALVVLPYTSAVLFWSVRERKSLRGLREKAFLPAAFAAMHFGFSRGLWTGLLKALRRGTE